MRPLQRSQDTGLPVATHELCLYFLRSKRDSPAIHSRCVCEAGSRKPSSERASSQITDVFPDVDTYHELEVHLEIVAGTPAGSGRSNETSRNQHPIAKH
jgi:hypothetical protein